MSPTYFFEMQADNLRLDFRTCRYNLCISVVLFSGRKSGLIGKVKSESGDDNELS
jgi:hypothetical protein